MVYANRFLFGCFILLLAGCSTFGRNNRIAKSYEEGYRLGVKENINDFAEHFYGNDFPYFVWASPVIQSVRVPGHIENGVYIPEHNEPVVIEPGEWRNKFAYPINSGIKNEKKTKQKEGEDTYALEYLNFDTRDITVLPESYLGAKSGNKEKGSD